jgi:hypothetical protein
MATFSTNLALTLQTTGENPGTWGDVTNTNLGTLLEQAVSGYTTQAITDGADTAISISNGVSSIARNMTIEMTGALTASRNMTVPTNRKLYFIYNNTTGSQSVTVKVAGQTGVLVPNGKRMALVCNGTDVVEAVTYFTTFGTGSINATPIGNTTASSGAFTTLSASSTVSGTGFSTYLASPPAIGGTLAAAGTFTNVNVTDTALPAVGLYRSTTNTLAFSSNTITRGNVGSAGAWTFAAPTSGNHIFNLLAGSNGLAFTTGSHNVNLYSDGSTHYTFGTATTIPLRILANNVVVATFASGGGLTIAAPATTTIPALVAAGGAATTSVAVTFNATTMTVNCALSNVFATTFTANVTVAPTVSNPSDGQTINWFITQDATGSRTMTWPTSFKWPGGTAGVLSTAANSVDLVVATYRSATGFWYVSLAKAFS